MCLLDRFSELLLRHHIGCNMPPKRTKSAASVAGKENKWEQTLMNAVFCEKVTFLALILIDSPMQLMCYAESGPTQFDDFCNYF